MFVLAVCGMVGVVGVVCVCVCVVCGCCVCGTSHQEHGVSVQARVYGQALDDEELFIIEGSPGAQLQKTGGTRKMPHFTSKKPTATS